MRVVRSFPRPISVQRQKRYVEPIAFASMLRACVNLYALFEAREGERDNTHVKRQVQDYDTLAAFGGTAALCFACVKK